MNFLESERCALVNALNKLASVSRGLECGFLNDTEAREQALVIRNQLEDEQVGNPF